jgi:hypothetical protein
VQFLSFSMISPRICLAAGFNWDSVNGKLILPFIILFVLLLLPHWIAAKLLAPRPTVWLVIAAAFLQIVFSVGAAFVTLVFLAMGGAGAMALVFVVVLVLSALITAGIYGFGLGRGFVYNLLVACLCAAMGWAVEQAGQAGVFEPIFGKQDSLEKSAGSPTENASDAQAPRFANSQEAQAEALRRYPDLGKSGSAFNQRFLEKHKRYQKEKPDVLSGNDWPILIATEVATELGVP